MDTLESRARSPTAHTSKSKMMSSFIRLCISMLDCRIWRRDLDDDYYRSSAHIFFFESACRWTILPAPPECERLLLSQSRYVLALSPVTQSLSGDSWPISRGHLSFRMESPHPHAAPTCAVCACRRYGRGGTHSTRKLVLAYNPPLSS